MISHKHKCIFIHISKCAGSSIETAFGIDISNNTEANNKNLFGWNDNLKIHLQHATPQELLDNGIVSREVWQDYYKFIVVRNPWDRAYSDYIWLNNEQKYKDDFINFINKRGEYEEIMTQSNIFFRGDHLTSQKDYFFLDNSLISYNRVIRFENLSSGLKIVEEDLRLRRGFFDQKVNANIKKLAHYSLFYNQTRKKIIAEKYRKDIDFLNYSFLDKKLLSDKLKAFFIPSNKLV